VVKIKIPTFYSRRKNLWCMGEELDGNRSRSGSGGEKKDPPLSLLGI
jgi:hypothetical protein